MNSNADLELSWRIEELVGASEAEVVGVAIHGLESDRHVLIREHESFHAASTMKVGVMVEVFRQANLGLFALDDGLPVTNVFHSLVDGSEFALTPEDDSDAELYDRIGAIVTIRDLVTRMIAVSSNLATNILLGLVSAENVSSTMCDLGAEGFSIRRGVEDGKAFRLGLNNTATAYSLLKLLLGIGRSEVVSAQASQEMLAILRSQEFNEGIPARLPTGTFVAHKTGWTSTVYHDAGIVRAPQKEPFALVVLTQGLSHEKAGPELVSSVAKLAHEFF